jgi:hypothetical protein
LAVGGCGETVEFTDEADSLRLASAPDVQTYCRQAILPDTRRNLMKLSRVLLACTFLLLTAVPMFAAPPCTACLDEGTGPCINDPDAGTRCRFTGGSCQTLFQFCIGFGGTPLLAEWQVASVEITRPDPATEGSTKVVTAPAAVAEVQTPHVSAQN